MKYNSQYNEVISSLSLLRGRDAPVMLGRFFLWKNGEGDDIIKVNIVEMKKCLNNWSVKKVIYYFYRK